MYRVQHRQGGNCYMTRSYYTTQCILYTVYKILYDYIQYTVYDTLYNVIYVHHTKLHCTSPKPTSVPTPPPPPPPPLMLQHPTPCYPALRCAMQLCSAILPYPIPYHASDRSQPGGVRPLLIDAPERGADTTLERGRVRHPLNTGDVSVRALGHSGTL